MQAGSQENKKIDDVRSATYIGISLDDIGVSHLAQRHNLFSYFTTQKKISI